ncbi:MAG TPA: alpha/beta hydrolase [Blastocatellia bacterium]|nr:alpha/beta hydrolase [Blastocatellia bacterium]
MRRMPKTVSFILSACLLCAAVLASPQDKPAAERKAGDLKKEPYKLQFGDQSVEAELGRLLVKENRSNPKSNLIELAFVRLKSTAGEPGPPVIYLDGGPGSSAINLARVPDYARAFLKLREVGDVILLDQRGVGLSRPNLARMATQSMPADAFLNREKAFAVFKERAEEAAAHFKSQGVDLLAYNTRESAADVDDLRRALGVEKVNLVGFSYGTHLGLATIRYHGAHLNRVALVGTEGQNHTRKLPSTSQKSLERLARVVAADPTVGPKVPDMVALLKRVFDRLEREPITVRITDRRNNQPVDLKVGKFGLQFVLLIDLGDTNDLPIFPALFYTIDRGDYSMLARMLERRYNQFGAGINMMTMVMDAASGASKARDAQIEREAKSAIFNDTINFPFPEIGRVFGNPDLGDEFRSAIRTDVPTLFISGSFDNNTPPWQADEVRKSFKHSAHIVVENAGHESSLVEPRVQQAMVDFLRGKDVSGVKISLPPLRFQPIPEPKADAKN